MSHIAGMANRLPRPLLDRLLASLPPSGGLRALVAFAVMGLPYGVLVYFGLVDPGRWLGKLTTAAFIAMAFASWSMVRTEDRADYLALEELAGQGIDLEPPREVRFKLSVPAGVATDRVSESLRADGYLVEALEATGTRPLCARHVITLYGDDLKVRRRYFSRLAAEVGGQYLGWELLDRSPIGRGAIASG